MTRILTRPALRLLRLCLPLWTLQLLSPGHCDEAGPTSTLRTELEDLHTMKSRVLIDFPTYRCRLMYVEKRSGADPGLQPEQWSFGITSPLIIAGPVSLEGVLAQLHNPLAHGPGSKVFSDKTGLALDIDMDVASRGGAQLMLVPEHWYLFGVHKDQSGIQLGSGITMPFGESTVCELAGLLSAPPDKLTDNDGWYEEAAPYPGGHLSHLAVSLSCGSSPLRLHALAAASAGQRVSQGILANIYTGWVGSHGKLVLLFGYCSAGYRTPEGQVGDLEWKTAVRVDRDLESLRLFAGYGKEISRLSLHPAAFRESQDHLEGGIEIRGRTASGCAWSMEGEAATVLRWSTAGAVDKELCLEATGTLDSRAWRLVLGMGEKWSSNIEPCLDAHFSISYHPPWGRAELEVAYQHTPVSAFRLAAAVEGKGENKRIYARLESREALSLDSAGKGWQEEDWLQLFSLRLGWEVKTRLR